MILLTIKKIISKFLLIDSYCKNCGKKVSDFSTHDFMWNAVKEKAHIKGDVLCASCFIKIANKNNIIVTISNKNILRR